MAGLWNFSNSNGIVKFSHDLGEDLEKMLTGNGLNARVELEPLHRDLGATIHFQTDSRFVGELLVTQCKSNPEVYLINPSGGMQQIERPNFSRFASLKELKNALSAYENVENFLGGRYGEPYTVEANGNLFYRAPITAQPQIS